MSRDGTVRLSEHQEMWDKAFEVLSHDVAALMAPYRLTLHHVGSTAIPGIKAKPILDVLGVVDSLAQFDLCQSRLEAYGITCKGEYGIAGRRYCVLYDSTSENAYAHFHIYEHGHPEIEQHLFFRNYLRAHPDAAQDYQNLKEGLMLQHQGNRAQYTKDKAGFIQGILKRAVV